MLRDSDAGRGDSGRRKPAADWKVWITSPRHVPVTIASVAAAGLLIGYLVSAVAVFPSQGVGSDLQSVPELVGRSVVEARTAVERLGLVYEEGSALYHPEVPSGTVVAQDPLSRQSVRAGSSVQVTLSLGPKRRLVPDVVGLSRRQAEVALERAGFETDAIVVDADAEVGQVVGVRPSPGTAVALPGNVGLVVSAGPPSVAVPDLVSRSTAEAGASLERLGLRLGSVSRDSTSLAAPGTVMAQSPTAGAVVERGTRISVTVATVPPPGQVDSGSESDTLSQDSTQAEGNGTRE